jgi:tRNA threonylcarbamoyladenosine biosynthesis protein TsaE
MSHALLNRVDLVLQNEAATTALGKWLAPALQAGDTVLLSGQIGAGKTHLVRAVLQHRLGPGTEVPSPTFTLVQAYDDAALTIVHADLYRVSHPDEVLELGLDEAMRTGIALVEWPERLGAFRPEDALNLTLQPLGAGRHVIATGPARLVNHIAGFPSHRAHHA